MCRARHSLPDFFGEGILQEEAEKAGRTGGWGREAKQGPRPCRRVSVWDELWTWGYAYLPIDEGAELSLRPGLNVIAIHCRQDIGGQYIDAGISMMESSAGRECGSWGYAPGDVARQRGPGGIVRGLGVEGGIAGAWFGSVGKAVDS